MSDQVSAPTVRTERIVTVDTLTIARDWSAPEPERYRVKVGADTITWLSLDELDALRAELAAYVERERADVTMPPVPVDPWDRDPTLPGPARTYSGRRIADSPQA